MSDRFEVLPFARAEDEAAKLPEHVRLTVTCSPTHGLDRTIETATRLRLLGHAVTVHLAARMILDRDHLDRVLATMSDGGIDDALVIGGDATPPLGPYPSAGELLKLVNSHPRRPRVLGIAGYPEGHPLIDSARLVDVLLRWVRETREAGIELPVLLGVPGVVDRRKLLQISARVGVGPSLSFLRKQGGLRNLLRLSRTSADQLYDALASHVGNADLNVTGFHWFTFNRLVETWTWERGKHA